MNEQQVDSLIDSPRPAVQWPRRRCCAITAVETIKIASRPPCRLASGVRIVGKSHFGTGGEFHEAARYRCPKVSSPYDDLIVQLTSASGLPNSTYELDVYLLVVFEENWRDCSSRLALTTKTHREQIISSKLVTRVRGTKKPMIMMRSDLSLTTLDPPEPGLGL